MITKQDLAILDDMPLIDYIKERSRKDEETGCVIWLGPKIGGHPSFGKTVTFEGVRRTFSVRISQYLRYFETGKYIRREHSFAVCGNKLCINLDHRKFLRNECRKEHKFDKRKGNNSCPKCQAGYEAAYKKRKKELDHENTNTSTPR